MVTVKVCGITNLADAEKALEFGADWLGFNFYPPSPRCITPAAAWGMLAQLPAGRFHVALFVNESRARVSEVLGVARDEATQRGYSAVQFHGEESAEYCRAWPVKVIKAFRMRTREVVKSIEQFPADYYLLDSWSPGYGGSGKSFPWEWLEGIDNNKIIMSGGLTIDNVTEAVCRLRPFGVDVCSGVEAKPGLKDHVKLKEFIAAAKNA